MDLTKIQKNNYLSHEFIFLGNDIGVNGNGGNGTGAKPPRDVTESRHMYVLYEEKQLSREYGIGRGPCTFLMSSHWVNPIVYAVFYTEKRPEEARKML